MVVKQGPPVEQIPVKEPRRVAEEISSLLILNRCNGVFMLVPTYQGSMSPCVDVVNDGDDSAIDLLHDIATEIAKGELEEVRADLQLRQIRHLRRLAQIDVEYQDLRRAIERREERSSKTWADLEQMRARLLGKNDARVASQPGGAQPGGTQPTQAPATGLPAPGQPAPNQPAQTPAQQPGQQPGQQPAQTPETQPGQPGQPARAPAPAQPGPAPTQQPGQQPGQPAQVPAQQPGQQPGQQPAQTPAQQPGQQPRQFTQVPRTWRDLEAAVHASTTSQAEEERAIHDAWNQFQRGRHHVSSRNEYHDRVPMSA